MRKERVIGDTQGQRAEVYVKREAETGVIHPPGRPRVASGHLKLGENGMKQNLPQSSRRNPACQPSDITLLAS